MGAVVVVSRALSRLRQDGLIQIDGRRGAVCDEQALEVFAEG
jgi:DNA-binding GntR family transcriptional regulator